MRLAPCACGINYLVRLNRAFWMRWLPGRGHYFCIRCNAHQWLSRRGLRRLFPQMAAEMDFDDTLPAPLDEAAPPAREPAARQAASKRTNSR